MRTVLICHADDPLNHIGTARWMNSFSDLVGVIAIEEGRDPVKRRIRRELKRVGWLRFLDVFAFRVYHRLFLAAADRRQEAAILTKLCEYPPLPESTLELITDNPNRDEVRQFLLDRTPDLILARCKFLLKEEIFNLARIGTFVMHPGICPEYRNAHGCFWAFARNDLANVGLTLLKIDRGVDTGPVYGYYRYPFDEVTESHIVIQHRCGFENLDSIAEKFREIERGTPIPIDTTGRSSSVWGQPWLTAYLRWKRAARKRRSRA